VRVGAVLDVSALVSHARLDHVGVGELVHEVGHNGDVVGVPALAVLVALSQLTGSDRERLEQLVTFGPPVVVLPLEAEDVLEVDRVGRLIAGGLGEAHAVVEANRWGALLATNDRGSVGVGVVIDDESVWDII
jgi:hypothetical protein